MHHIELANRVGDLASLARAIWQRVVRTRDTTVLQRHAGQRALRDRHRRLRGRQRRLWDRER
eukprot:CAMPEP_0115712898 /NCGR_PEP_ID=MMETSP0272-20121206/74372_1 /TAXON_ID=71861 /ORGANISM="Scrippsiella trochoidea, Strain CCMP3099" /LENGTH=61 /DNA_ID=CAMNT_0003154849 /DNA_START=101 /DNA_END=283 /DNA_ORIENTATION=+